MAITGIPALIFNETTIQRIFGHEAAEDERIERLKEYYFKGKIYEKMTANLPLRIFVGHKGIGKSALFTYAMHEDAAAGRISVLIRPDDISGIGKADDFLTTIREWKLGLQNIIAQKILGSMGIDASDLGSKLKNYAGRFLSFAKDTVKPYADGKINLAPAQATLIKAFH